MKKHKIVVDGFEWISPHERISKYGPSNIPIKKESRTPLLWLAREEGELYLVNNSQETLDWVLVGTGGFQTLDEDVIPLRKPCSLFYEEVKPKDAVLLDTFDGIYDLDYLFQVSMLIQSEMLGRFEIRSPAGKGEIKETVLLWNTGELGKNVYCEKLITNLLNP